MNQPNQSTLAPPPSHPLVRFFSSIRLGIVLMVLILAYACAGSALAPVRGALELTEMAVFRHWLFLVLIALLSVSLVAATVTRIRWNWINAGVLMVHSGLLLLIGGATWYFYQKVEGGVLLASPRIELQTADGRTLPGAEFLAWQGEVWQQVMPAFGGAVRLEVVEANGRPDQPLTEAVVRAQFGNAPPRVVTVPANAPAPTSLDNGLALRLRTFAGQSQFCDDEVPVLCYGPKGAASRFAPLTGLPHHRERYLPGEGTLRDSAGRLVPSKRTSPYIDLGFARIPTGWFEPWRLPIKLNTTDLPFDVEVTGFVPYISSMQSSAAGGAETENPLATVRLEVGSESLERTLAAFDPLRQRLELRTPIIFRWVRSPSERDAAAAPPPGAPPLGPDGGVLILAGPEVPPELIVLPADGEPQRFELRVGQKQPIRLPGFEVDFTLTAYERFGRLALSPVLEALEVRRPNLGRGPSAIRLKLTGRGALAGWSESRWCTYSEFPNAEPAPELAPWAAHPVTVRVPDGREYDLVYSRAQRDLGATLVGGRLLTNFFPGRRRVESWRSDFHVRAAGSTTFTPAAVYTNQTYVIGPWTLFQSGADSANHWRWTILGVGNRRGMWPMIIGCVLITVGCLYAFYVKPVLRQRARGAGTASAGRRENQAIPSERAEPVGAGR